jgi:hypothetical protein
MGHITPVGRALEACSHVVTIRVGGDTRKGRRSSYAVVRTRSIRCITIDLPGGTVFDCAVGPDSMSGPDLPAFFGWRSRVGAACQTRTMAAVQVRLDCLSWSYRVFSRAKASSLMVDSNGMPWRWALPFPNLFFCPVSWFKRTLYLLKAHVLVNLYVQAMDAAKVEDHIKECWTIVLKGDNALLREWISRCLDWSQPLPSVEYQVHNNGFVALGPFLSQVDEMIRVAPMPAQDTLIDQFALRGVIFPRDLPEGVAAPGAPALDREGAGDDSAPGAAQGATETDFSRLLVRLSKCNLLFRPLDLSGNVRLTLDTLLPYEVEAPFHHFMVRHCLEHDLQPVLEAYTVWHNLYKCSFDTFYPIYKKTASSSGYAFVTCVG